MSRCCMLLAAIASLLLGGCAANGQFDTGRAVSIGAGALRASLLEEEDVRRAAALSAEEIDARHRIAPPGNPYAVRLASLTRNLHQHDGLRLNFKVYLDDQVNAFAMADGTIRVYAGLLDLMPDDQVRAVIGHEIGHVKLKHSYRQMREALLTQVAFETAASVPGTIGALSSSQLGKLAYAAINARFSQQDELESDTYAVRMLHNLGHDPQAMLRSIHSLQSRGGGSGGFLSTHPSNRQRLEHIEAQIRAL